MIDHLPPFILPDPRQLCWCVELTQLSNWRDLQNRSTAPYKICVDKPSANVLLLHRLRAGLLDDQLPPCIRPTRANCAGALSFHY